MSNSHTYPHPLAPFWCPCVNTPSILVLVLPILPRVTMDRFLTTSIRSSAASDDIILAPQSINSSASDPPSRVGTFKLYGKQYIRCGALTKNPKATRQRSSPIWKWGEDIQLIDSDSKTTYFYCYLCERQKRKQELMIVLTGRCTALDHRMSSAFVRDALEGYI
jgi:hypothetical protein